MIHQQIEEMARDLVANWEWMSGYDDYNDGDIMDTVATCKKMHEQGYRKIDEDKVVLTREEYHNDFSSQFNKGYKHGSKETAREIIEFAERFFTWDEEGFVRELKSQYGVEIEK